MAILSKGKTFTSGDQVTATSLNELVDNATFASGAVDDSTTQLSSGRIIVKDSGITSSKLNLSVNGASQNIAQFKTLQGSSARALSIRTPASTSDITSPFEIQTGNALQFIVDDHTVTIDSDGKTTFGTGSILTSDTALHQVNINTDDALGATAGNSQGILRLVETTSNQDNLLFTAQRVSDGSDWQTAAHRIQRKVDATKMGYIQFGNNNASNGGLITFGENETERMRIDAEGHVGIGTTTPSEALEVSGNILATNGTESVQLANSGSIEIRHSSGPFIDFKNANEDRDCRIFQDSDGLGFQVGGSSAVATKMELTSDGKVQIKGQISNGDAQLQLISDSGSDTSILAFGDNDDSDIGGIRYDHSDNSMRFATSTSEQVRIDSTGNVGIGATSPDGNLHVVGATGDKGRIFLCDRDNGTGQADSVAIVKDGVNASVVNRDGGYLQLGANNSHFVTLSSDGNVGIGDDSPSKELVVKNAATTSTESVINVISGNQGVAGVYLGDSDDDIVGGIVYDNSTELLQLRSSNNNTAVSIDSSENVGIGTTAPDGKLHVGTGNNSDGTDLNIVIGGDTANSRQAIITKKIQSSDRALEIYASGSDSDEDIRFFTDTGTERMRIEAAGNVGIGTTEPSSELEVVGDVRANNIVGREANNGIIIKSDPEAPDGTDGGSEIALYSQDFTATRSQIYHKARYSTFQDLTPTDIVIIGDQSGTNTLKVIGNIQYTGTSTDISDSRLKENVEPLTGSLDKICQLEAKSYTMVDDEDKTEELGFIAQDVQQIFPNLVKEHTNEEKPEGERGDPFLSVAYIQLIAPMVEAIKELKSENEALKTRVAALES
jgi:hypothetical protein